MKIPFTKAHGAKNDFLLTWAGDAPGSKRDEVARAVCDRHTGIGADGWMLMTPGTGEAHASIQLYNSDGSTSEISGNGTRCVAAFLVYSGLVSDTEVRIQTGAGLKRLRLIDHEGLAYRFEMEMGPPSYTDKERQGAFEIGAETLDATILNVGNPQCAVFVEDFGLDWRRLGAAIECHPAFPNRTNVSFIRVLDRNTIEVRIWERGAGETMSSGTGSTGAAFAALLRGLVESPVRVVTAAGDLNFRVENGTGYLTGPAELVGSGEYYV